MLPMRESLHRLLLSVAAIVMTAAPLSVVHAADLMDARVWAGPAYTRVVLDVAGPLNYTVSHDADQMVIDLGDSRVADSFADPPAQGLYRGMTHVGSGHQLKLLARLAPGSLVKSFVLKPTKGTDYRLVLDLYPATAKDAESTPLPAGESGRSAVAAATGAAPVSVRASIEAAPLRGRSHTSLAITQQAAALLNGQRKVVVVIDAGHGGKDQGAHGPGGTLEKNVTLAVALDLAAIINRQPGMKAVLTRNGDYFIPLSQRYQIARENNADLFVSIHADSYPGDDARGSSVWVLSPRGKTNEAARVLADRENADLIGGATLDGMNDSLAKVVLDLQQSWAIQASDVVAGNVLRALANIGPTHRGYVERANFVVLRSPDVPSILVETAFISNPSEERKLRDPTHQKQIADAVMSGVKNYFETTPPPGTWFAAQAARRNGSELAKTTAPTHETLSSASARASTAHGKSAGRADANVLDLHRVSRGESLGSIARHYGVSVGALKSANRIDADSVRAGTVLTIPAS